MQFFSNDAAQQRDCSLYDSMGVRQKANGVDALVPVFFEQGSHPFVRIGQYPQDTVDQYRGTVLPTVDGKGADRREILDQLILADVVGRPVGEEPVQPAGVCRKQTPERIGIGSLIRLLQQTDVMGRSFSDVPPSERNRLKVFKSATPENAKMASTCSMVPSRAAAKPPMELPQKTRRFLPAVNCRSRSATFSTVQSVPLMPLR